MPWFQQNICSIKDAILRMNCIVSSPTEDGYTFLNILPKVHDGFQSHCRLTCDQLHVSLMGLNKKLKLLVLCFMKKSNRKLYFIG